MDDLKRLTVDVPADLLRELDEYRKRDRMSRGVAVRILLRRGLVTFADERAARPLVTGVTE